MRAMLIEFTPPMLRVELIDGSANKAFTKSYHSVNMRCPHVAYAMVVYLTVIECPVKA